MIIIVCDMEILNKVITYMVVDVNNKVKAYRVRIMANNGFMVILS